MWKPHEKPVVSISENDSMVGFPDRKRENSRVSQ